MNQHKKIFLLSSSLARLLVTCSSNRNCRNNFSNNFNKKRKILKVIKRFNKMFLLDKDLGMNGRVNQSSSNYKIN